MGLTSFMKFNSPTYEHQFIKIQISKCEKVELIIQGSHFVVEKLPLLPIKQK